MECGFTRVTFPSAGPVFTIAFVPFESVETLNDCRNTINRHTARECIASDELTLSAAGKRVAGGTLRARVTSTATLSSNVSSRGGLEIGSPRVMRNDRVNCTVPLK